MAGRRKLSKRARTTRSKSRKSFAGGKGAKACTIMRHGKIGGKPLTKQQKGMFGARCGEYKKRTGKK